jgi:hypothetical protein
MKIEVGVAASLRYLEDPAVDLAVGRLAILVAVLGEIWP